ncbi:protein-L-isoaspartate O-methyltransferase [Erythrobacter sp. 3-20A1M]|uniref:protein-L-isoaspartate O-methyltransferase family protein n=1 Tax=Erythrobacter sp. 3-20A1M TaxID=2653850 RepID=UPI001BFCB557|nr:protein-L-isoaspartate O-methyltransferase [Erythrobacter sp. 3-20A1M]QWC56781.1 protein-L-isoaspartate O-methyltransferase [Erythrobacter sp. 3-20A1M]
MIDSAARTLDFAAARRAMIDSQLRTSGINDPAVLDRMGTVPREDFVPPAARGYCYMDRAIPLEDGGMLAPPPAHGMMLEEARPKKTDSALVVTNGSAYLAALLRPLVASVETMPAAETVEYKGRKSFDLVLVDGAIEHAPAALAKLVAEDGRLVTGLVDRGLPRLALGRRSGKELALLPIQDIALPRLPAFDKPKGWSF